MTQGLEMTKSGSVIGIPGSNRQVVPDAKLIGRSDPRESIEVSIYVRRNPRAGAPAYASAEDLKLPGQRHYFRGVAFDRAYGADQSDLDKVVSWAKSRKLRVLETSVPKRRVLVRGSIADISDAFGVELNDYRHAEGGKFRGREGQIYLPHELHGVVDGVFGLDTRRLGRPRRRRGRFLPEAWTAPKAARGARATSQAPSNPFPGTFFPPEVAALYQYPPSLDGTGQNVAIFAFNGAPDGGDPHGGYSLPALKTYFERVLGGKTPSISDVVVAGPGNDPGPDSQASSQQGDATGEVMLDMCVTGSVAPGAKIFMYFTEFTGKGWIDALHEAVTDGNDISVISISYGNPETGPGTAWTAMGVRTVNTALEAAAAKGITVCVSSGDDGSSDGIGTTAHVDFPASSPYVLAVGGTKLVASSDKPPKIASETVWNETRHHEGATGGGISAIFTRPSWQDGARVPPSANPPHKIGRGLPDVAAVGDPVTGVVIMHVDGQHIEPIGGTSASAPLWASLVARLNQGLSARCGNLNPLLYTKFATGVLGDVTQGNNGAYAAGPGWDACTGLGTPRGQALLSALSGKKPPKSSGIAPVARQAH
jgi:kumamolisin